MMTLRTRLLSTATATLLLLACPSFAEASARTAPGSGGISQDYTDILENRLQALEEQVQRLTNQVEQATFQAQQAQTRLQKLEEDVNTRFRMMESQNGAAATAPTDANSGTPATPSPAPRATNMGSDEKTLGQLTSAPDGEAVPDAQPDSPNAAYDQAFSKVRDGDYEAAEAAMRAFIKRWPEHDLASNAAYWLAESFYARGDYETAAKSFAESYQKYPRGAKAEDTLVKLGLTLSALNRTRDACVTFGQAEKEFPNMSTTNKRRLDEERTQLGCADAATQAGSPAKRP